MAAARRGVCHTTPVVGVDDGVAGVADEGAREQQDRRCPLWLPSKKSDHVSFAALEGHPCGYNSLRL